VSTRITVAVLLPLVLTSGCGAPAHPPEGSGAQTVDRDDVELRDYDIAFAFDDPVVPGDVVPGAGSVGTLPLRASVVTLGGGELTWTPDLDEGWAVRTPAARADGAIRAAAIVVWPDAAGHAQLDPGRRTVRLQADLRADAPAPPRPGDDGDNVVQWGRFGDPAQVKLQLDHGTPSCRAVGSDRAVLVAADRKVVPDRWYRLTCSVRTGEVRLQLLDLERGGEPSEWSQPIGPGAMVFGPVPLSIGAKVGASGQLDRRSVDQFNGVIDRVVVDVR
jgi:hypothetical protein